MSLLKHVEDEVLKVTNLVESSKTKCLSTIDDLIDTIGEAKEKINSISQNEDEELSYPQISIFNQLCDQIKKSGTTIIDSHRVIHSSLSKIGKTIDKNFIPNYSECVNCLSSLDKSENNQLINEAIVEQLLRQNSMSVAKKLIEEANLNFNRSRLNSFMEAEEILVAIRKKEINTVLNWAEKHREQLDAIGSSLEFKAHRLNIIELLKQGVNSPLKVIEYIREKMQNFGHGKHQKEIQHLMGALIFLRVGIANSPYKPILDPINYDDLEQVFIRDASALFGLTIRSPVEIAIEAGAIALPALLNIDKMMKDQDVRSVWEHRDELPVEIDLGHKLHFHSTFSCPILKQQATKSNPPMRLSCGHVISKDALEQLSGSGSSIKLKCPYCPVELSKDDAREIFFNQPSQ